jgi:hypothetical protein
VNLVICFILGVIALITVGILVRRRRYRRIAELVVARGGTVVRTHTVVAPSIKDVVEYVSANGELRQAAFERGQSELTDDEPYQHVLKRNHANADNNVLASLKLVVECDRLPGIKQYKSIVQDLARGERESICIEETNSSAAAEIRFAPVLQCIEALNVGDDSGDPQLLDLMIDGQRTRIRWQIAGTSPRRVLTLTREVTQ